MGSLIFTGEATTIELFVTSRSSRIKSGYPILMATCCSPDFMNPLGILISRKALEEMLKFKTMLQSNERIETLILE